MLKLLLVTAFFNALSWIILIPVWQYPDEQAHFAQVQDLAELGRVPQGLDTSYEIALSEQILGTEREQSGNNKFTYHPKYKIEYADSLYGHQEVQIIELPQEARTKLVKRESTVNPPLYYLVGSLVYKLFYSQDLFTRVYVVRMMSLVFFLLTVLIAFKIGQLIFEKNNGFALTLASLTVFKPMLIFASTGVLPDSLTNLLFTVVLLLSINLLKNGFQFFTTIMILLTIILGVLTRQQFLISILIVFLPIFYYVFKKPIYLKKTFAAILIVTAFLYFTNSVGVSLPFFNNFRVADLGIISFEKTSFPTFKDHLIWSLKHSIDEVWPWYWGVYKWLSLTVPHINYQIINRIIIIGILGILIKVGKMLIERKLTRSDVVLLFMIMASAIYFLIFLVWDYFFRLKNGFSFGIQGRYYFPVVVVHLAIITIGLTTIFEFVLKKYAKYAFFLLILLMVIFNDFSLFFVSSTYYDLSTLDSFIKQASQYKPILLKGNILIFLLFANILLQAIFLFSLIKYTINNHESTKRTRF